MRKIPLKVNRKGYIEKIILRIRTPILYINLVDSRVNSKIHYFVKLSCMGCGAIMNGSLLN